MADQNASREDKKLPASEQKIRKARADGQVARSRDLGHALLLSATLGCLVLFVAPVGMASRQLIASGLRFDAGAVFSDSALTERLSELSLLGFHLVWPVAAVGTVASMLASTIPGGLVLTLKPLAAKLERISPLQGLKRIFSRSHLIDSIKLSVLIALLGVITGISVVFSFDQILHMMRQPTATAMKSAWSFVALGTASLLLLLALVALIDVPLQWFRKRTELMMTFQEARQEQKETEGDPYLKARIRARQREISNVRMMADVPTADIVISNPSHYAVALKYEESGFGAPTVIASGVDHVALRIREVAKVHGIPNIEAPPLARALWAHVPVGQEIPAALYNAVAQVLAYLFRLRQAQIGLGKWPDLPSNLPVPEDLDPATEKAVSGDEPPAGQGA
ncbi:MAG: EscU/YscU/HrcU family type III secretion system export apparatus switch protein [Burkholderiaceae bacterium]